MSAKCMHRWVDPIMGRSRHFVGPYSCGRRPGHPGVHAWSGNGAAALWSDDGELFMAVQRMMYPLETPLPDVLDKDAGEHPEGDEQAYAEQARDPRGDPTPTASRSVAGVADPNQSGRG